MRLPGNKRRLRNQMHLACCFFAFVSMTAAAGGVRISGCAQRLLCQLEIKDEFINSVGMKTKHLSKFPLSQKKVT